MGKNILNALKVILPIAAFILIPWAITFVKPEWRDSSFGTIWVCSVFGILAAFVVGTIIYGSVTNIDLTKTKAWIFIFGK